MNRNKQHSSMPPNDTSNDDEGFLTLLSAQRELLNQMNRERVVDREQRKRLLQQSKEQEQQRQRLQQKFLIQQFQQQLFHQYGTGTNGTIGGSYEHPNFPSFAVNTSPKDMVNCHQGVDPFSLMNQPIINRRSSMEYLYTTRRLSLGMGGGFKMHGEPEDVGEWMNVNEIGKDCTTSEDQHPIKRKSQRRRSSCLGIVSALMQEDLKMSAARRLSLVSTFSRSLLDAPMLGEEMDENASLQESIDVMESQDCDSFLHQNFSRLEEHDVSLLKQNCLVLRKTEIQPPRMRLDPSVDLPTLTSMIKIFAGAMDSSAKSQQDIHDWDRKMGLKRSHSKTMRLSMRSRKKLRAIMNREIATIKAFEKSAD